MNFRFLSASNWLKANFIIIFTIPIVGWQLGNGWFYFGTREGFGDILYVLERADCLPLSMETLYSERTNNVCTGYIYGSTLLRVLNFLGIGQSVLIPIGYTLFAIVGFFYLKATKNSKNIFQVVLYLSLFFSPPMILLFERANLDSLILILVTIYATLVVRKHFLGAFFLAALASLFKFYSIPLLFVAIFGAKKFFRFPLIIMSLLVSIQVLLDIEKIPQLPWDAQNMFGNIVWGEYLLYLLKGSSTHANFFFSTILGLGILSIIWCLLKRKLTVVEYWTYIGSRDQIFFLVYLSMYLACFFIGLSVDYRLVFLLFAFIYFEKTIKLKASIKFLTRSCILITFYSSYNLAFLQPLGDLAQMVFIAILAILMEPYFKLTASRIINKIQVVTTVVLNRTSRD
jgi:hypothetical protein